MNKLLEYAYVAQSKAYGYAHVIQSKTYDYGLTLQNVIANNTPIVVKNGYFNLVKYINKKTEQNNQIDEIEMVDYFPFLCAMKG